MSQLPISEKCYVYLACCSNGTFYVGCTKDVVKRIAAHNAGRGGQYTRTNRPLSLVTAWPFNSRAEAFQAERELKRLPHERKYALAQAAESLKGENQ
ncbi:MAG TPA: GIY-YIG nuclease family protein [Ktedonobacteraceae bacterium]|nr:GIY-YIG nuclease family protein [Ktedonobacteraceae bacterium]HEU5381853.1 GIY-YIG nuclease family protein [Ktedonobacteraceae bacterium]